MRQKISQQASIQYLKVSSIEEIKDVPKLDYHDLSELNLREYKDLFDYAPTEPMPRSGQPMLYGQAQTKCQTVSIQWK